MKRHGVFVGYDDNGDDIISVRISQPLFDAARYTEFCIDRFEIDMETGVGSGDGSNPMAGLSWSLDGGHTWSNEYTVSIGKIGEYKKKLVWRRLGQCDSRIFKLTISAAVKRALLGAYAEVSE